MSAEVERLKALCPMPALMRLIGLGEYAKPSVRSPFRTDNNPSWGIFQRDGKWFFKDQATGDSGDEFTLLARWKGLDEKRDFRQLVRIYSELAGVASNPGSTRGKESAARENANSPVSEDAFSWMKLTTPLAPADVRRLASWRGYSPQFCEWLSAANHIRVFKGNWAFPVHDETNVIGGCHYRVERVGGARAAWFYHPNGIHVQPLIFGDPKSALHFFIFESQWDAFAVMDKLGWHKPKGIPKTAIVITRGAGNGKLVAGLAWPGMNAYAFKQNDETINGKNAADEWLKDVSGHAGCEVLYVATPLEHKDANDWTHGGATGQQIMTAIQDARRVELASPSTDASKGKPQTEGESLGQNTAWPKPLGAAAMHGVMGDFVRLLDPHTEADPAALMVQSLIGFGNLMGRTAHFVVEGRKHYANMNCVLVGNTSKARKGVSWGRVCALLESVDRAWTSPTGGLSTGEGLIWGVRDPVIKKNSKGEEKIEDEGVVDKRLLVVEEEYVRVLKCANRENNTLSAVMRQAFDTGKLRILTKTNPAQATEAHISTIGHITRQELSRHLTDTECANGYANRILWAEVRRSKELPDGGYADLVDFSGVEAQLKKALSFARGIGELRRDSDARELWHSIYHDLSAAKPGLFGAITSRAEVYVARLSLVYAVLDCSEFIRREHLEAALEVWRYCKESARHIFGDALGDPNADALLAALRQAGANGLTRTEINEDVFNRHRTKAEIDRTLNLLVESGAARSESNPTDGRAAERWFAR